MTVVAVGCHRQVHVLPTQWCTASMREAPALLSATLLNCGYQCTTTVYLKRCKTDNSKVLPNRSAATQTIPPFPCPRALTEIV